MKWNICILQTERYLCRRLFLHIPMNSHVSRTEEWGLHFTMLNKKLVHLSSHYTARTLVISRSMSLFAGVSKSLPYLIFPLFIWTKDLDWTVNVSNSEFRMFWLFCFALIEAVLLNARLYYITLNLSISKAQSAQSLFLLLKIRSGGKVAAVQTSSFS